MFRQNQNPIDFRIEIVVEPEEERGFHAYCPALKGLHTCGDTREEALSNAKDAAIAYISSCIKHGDPIPIGVELHSKEAQEIQTVKNKEASVTYKENLLISCAI